MNKADLPILRVRLATMMYVSTLCAGRESLTSANMKEEVQARRRHQEQEMLLFSERAHAEKDRGAFAMGHAHGESVFIMNQPRQTRMEMRGSFERGLVQARSGQRAHLHRMTATATA
jgi:hypothetical protein